MSSSLNNYSNLLEILEKRFIENKNRHENIAWRNIKQKLEEHPEKLAILQKMEETGGEPDVVGLE
jgi:hypothetical protein